MIWKIFRFFLFLLDPEWAHELGALGLRLLGLMTQGNGFRMVAKTPRKLAGFRLDSPLGIAAGFDKDAKLVMGLRALGFGFVEVGTVTPRPQSGNPRPRLFRVPEADGLINRMGFNSEGSKAMARRLEDLRALAAIRFPIGVNLGKNRDTPLEEAVRDYAQGMEDLFKVADYFAINLSSPNTPGLMQLQKEEHLKPLLRTLQEANQSLAKAGGFFTKPLFLKISPDLSILDRRIGIESALEQGFQGIILSNTTTRRDFPELEGTQWVKEGGGLSGRLLKEMAYEQIREARRIGGTKFTLISVGGLTDEVDASARLDLGADLLQVYTEFVYAGPLFPRRIAKGLQWK